MGSTLHGATQRFLQTFLGIGVAVQSQQLRQGARSLTVCAARIEHIRHDPRQPVLIRAQVVESVEPAGEQPV